MRIMRKHMRNWPFLRIYGDICRLFVDYICICIWTHICDSLRLFFIFVEALKDLNMIKHDQSNQQMRTMWYSFFLFHAIPEQFRNYRAGQQKSAESLDFYWIPANFLGFLTTLVDNEKKQSIKNPVALMATLI